MRAFSEPSERINRLRPANRLLAALPQDDYRRLLPHLTTVPLNVEQLLHKRGEPLRYVYFPNGGICSVTTSMHDGASVEVTTIGQEGVIGAEALWGDVGAVAGDTLCQSYTTTAERMGVDAFRREIDGDRSLREIVGRYSHTLLGLSMQLAACNSLHDLQERFSRWLLTAHDRVGDEPLHLSHERLAIILGAARPTVSVVAANLQKAGAIQYKQARLVVTDREVLEARTCECYTSIAAELTRLNDWIGARSLRNPTIVKPAAGVHVVRPLEFEPLATAVGDTGGGDDFRSGSLKGSSSGTPKAVPFIAHRNRLRSSSINS
jgi:CRP-like cAMP-binding protein